MLCFVRSVVCFVALVSNNGNTCKLADELHSHFSCLFSNESSYQELLSVCCLAVLVFLTPKSCITWIKLHPGHSIDGYNDALNSLLWGSFIRCIQGVGWVHIYRYMIYIIHVYICISICTYAFWHLHIHLQCI